MRDAKTRRLLFLIIIPALMLPLTSSMQISDFAKGMTYGLLIGIQLLFVLRLKRHRMMTDDTSS